jgi:hypothetical protein
MRETSALRFFTPKRLLASAGVIAAPVWRAWNTLKVLVSGLMCLVALTAYKHNNTTVV